MNFLEEKFFFCCKAIHIKSFREYVVTKWKSLVLCPNTYVIIPVLEVLFSWTYITCVAHIPPFKLIEFKHKYISKKASILKTWFFLYYHVEISLVFFSQGCSKKKKLYNQHVRNLMKNIIFFWRKNTQYLKWLKPFFQNVIYDVNLKG